MGSYPLYSALDFTCYFPNLNAFMLYSSDGAMGLTVPLVKAFCANLDYRGVVFHPRGVIVRALGGCLFYVLRRDRSHLYPRVQTSQP
jgi:hypothetical protein